MAMPIADPTPRKAIAVAILSKFMNPITTAEIAPTHTIIAVITRITFLELILYTINLIAGEVFLKISARRK
jgi:hypothetical protein